MYISHSSECLFNLTYYRHPFSKCQLKAFKALVVNHNLVDRLWGWGPTKHFTERPVCRGLKWVEPDYFTVEMVEMGLSNVSHLGYIKKAIALWLWENYGKTIINTIKTSGS